MKKRFLSLALALGLCLTLLTVPAAAAETEYFPAAFQGDGYYITATPYEIQDEGWYLSGKLAFHEGLVMVYQDAQEMDSQGYYTGQTYQRVGYADKTGKVVLTFDSWEEPPASPGIALDYDLYFSDGMCVYYEWDTGLYGYVDRQGEPVIPAQYRSAEPFRDGVGRVDTTEGETLFLDQTGQVVFAPGENLDVGEFGDGLVSARGELESGDYFVGFLDKQGQPAISIYRGERSGYSTDEYLAVYDAGTRSRFSEGYAILADYRGGRTHPAYVFIDTQGNEVGVIDAQAPVYIDVSSHWIFSDGVVFVKIVDTAAGENTSTAMGAYVDIHGNIVFETSTGGVDDNDTFMLSGLARPRYGEEMFDRTGTVIIPKADVLEDLLPAFDERIITSSYSLMYDGIGLATLNAGASTYYYYLLEKHDGTYTGPGVVYDAATGTIHQEGTAQTPDPEPDPQPAGDQPSSWAAPQVNEAIAAGIVPDALQSGYTRPATRAEFCALAVELYEAVTGTEITQRATFTDTDDLNVQKMAGLGVVNGVGDGTFDPDGTLTREQAATMLVRLAEAMGHPLPEGTASFADHASIASWAVDAVGRAQAAGLMGGVGDNTFSPQGSYTVEQSILTALRLYDLT